MEPRIEMEVGSFGWMDGWMDGWMSSWVDVWTDIKGDR